MTEMVEFHEQGDRTMALMRRLAAQLGKIERMSAGSTEQQLHGHAVKAFNDMMELYLGRLETYEAVGK